jgi:outer membrane receptor protein involved in Fe transport
MTPTKTLLICLLCIPFFTEAQSTLSGAVTDVKTNQPLVGAHVALSSLDKLTLTNEQGRYTILNLDTGTYAVVVSFIGYDPISKEVKIEKGRANSLNIRMQSGELLLSDVTVSGDQNGPINTFSQVDINIRPISTSQDVLRMIPGLFIAQHAGGGKAEQIFLRGFDIDHGTDINLEVDGLPVNMVSHAHGQGYSDLHFLIPELINYVDFGKGPYYADKGDFTTAGYVSFVTKSQLDRNFLKTEGGQFGTFRTVAGVNLPVGKSTAYIPGEYFHSDGYFESLQHFNRFNIVGRFNTQLSKKDFLTASATFFTSRWDASGQIPQRAVNDGTITRFGSIDNSEGGNTVRINAFLKHGHLFVNGGFFEQQIYGVGYDFNLFSNFTFYLNDPVNGDEIQQQESRMIYGYKARYSQTTSLKGKELQTEIGAGVRYDDVNDISLSHVVKREFLNDVQRGDLNEANINAFVNENLILNETWSINAGLRFDQFYLHYNDKLLSTSKADAKSMLSPKLTVNYQLNEKTRFYAPRSPPPVRCGRRGSQRRRCS